MTRSDGRTAVRDVPRGAIAAGIGITIVAVAAGVLGGPVSLPIGGTLLELVDLIRDGTKPMGTTDHARHVIDIIESADSDPDKERLLFQEVWIPLAKLYQDRLTAPESGDTE